MVRPCPPRSRSPSGVRVSGGAVATPRKLFHRVSCSARPARRRPLRRRRGHSARRLSPGPRDRRSHPSARLPRGRQRAALLAGGGWVLTCCNPDPPDPPRAGTPRQRPLRSLPACLQLALVGAGSGSAREHPATAAALFFCEFLFTARGHFSLLPNVILATDRNRIARRRSQLQKALLLGGIFHHLHYTKVHYEDCFWSRRLERDPTRPNSSTAVRSISGLSNSGCGSSDLNTFC